MVELYSGKPRHLVSVIVPVYNVEQYIDQCLRSILAQTYQELEVLIMEGQSSDRSLEICKKWETLDPRIVVVSRKDGGLGPARNYGVKMAKGEFIFFVDSDDCLPCNAIEELIKKTDGEDVDLVVGGYRYIDENNNIQKYFFPLELGCDEVVQNQESRKKYIRRGLVAAWGKLYRASFLKDKHIEMPAVPAEDLAIFPIVTCQAKKIRCIDEIVYFYRQERKDSLSKNISAVIPMYKAVDYYCSNMKKMEWFDEYKEELFFLSRLHFTTWLNLFQKIFSAQEYQKIEKLYLGKLDEFFGVDSLKRHITIFPIGSYNVRSECKQIQGFEVTKRHYMFTGMVAQFYDNQLSNGEFHHENKFRDRCLQNDREKMVKRCLEEPKCIFREIVIDFMDDVNGVVLLSDGCVMSRTEAFAQSDKKRVAVKEVISSDDIVYWEMWKRACLNFIHCIEKKSLRVILVKNRYCKKFKDENGIHDFGKDEIIDKKNMFIERMEEYFLKNCNEKIYVVDIDPEKNYSDKYSRYSCSEEYLGIGGRNDVAEKIINIIHTYG